MKSNIVNNAYIGVSSGAEAVLKAFLDRDGVKGKPVSLNLVHMRSTLAVHRFDVAADAENWHGREDEIA